MTVLLWSVAIALAFVGGAWMYLNGMNRLHLQAREEELHTAYEGARGGLVATLNTRRANLQLEQRDNRRNLPIAAVICIVGLALLYIIWKSGY